MQSGLDGTIRIGLPSLDDPFAGTPWDADRQKIDATIEITLNGATAGIDDLIPLVAGASSLLTDVIIPEESTLVAGVAHLRTPDNAPLIKPGSASFLAPYGNYRDPDVDAAKFAQWWTDHHAPLAMKAFAGHASTYEQLHVHADATRAARESSGLHGAQYEIFESNRFAAIGILRAFFDQTDLMEEAYKDEVGFIAHDGRAAFGWLELA